MGNKLSEGRRSGESYERLETQESDKSTFVNLQKSPSSSSSSSDSDSDSGDSGQNESNFNVGFRSANVSQLTQPFLPNVTEKEDFARKRPLFDDEDEQSDNEEKDENVRKKQRMGSALRITVKEERRLRATEALIQRRFADLQNFELDILATERLLQAWRSFATTLDTYDKITSFLVDVDIGDLLDALPVAGQVDASEVRDALETEFQGRVRELRLPVTGVTLIQLAKIRKVHEGFLTNNNNGDLTLSESGDEIGHVDGEGGGTVETFRRFHLDIGLALLEVVDVNDIGDADNVTALHMSRHRRNGPGVAIITNVVDSEFVQARLYENIEQTGQVFFAAHSGQEMVQDMAVADERPSPINRIANLTLLYDSGVKLTDDTAEANPLIDQPQNGVWQRPLPEFFNSMQGLDKDVPHMLYTESQVLATVVLPLLNESALIPLSEAMLTIANDSPEQNTAISISNGNVKVSHRWPLDTGPLALDTFLPLRQPLKRIQPARKSSPIITFFKADGVATRKDSHAWTDTSRIDITYDRRDENVRQRWARTLVRPDALTNVALVIKKPLAIVAGSQLITSQDSKVSSELWEVLLEAYAFAVPENAIVMHNPDVWNIEPQRDALTIDVKRRFPGLSPFVEIRNLFPKLLEVDETVIRLTWQFHRPRDNDIHRRRVQLIVDSGLVYDQHIIWENGGGVAYQPPMELLDRIDRIRNGVRDEESIDNLSPIKRQLLGLVGDDGASQMQIAEALADSLLLQCSM
jgi:hypothetical protein